MRRSSVRDISEIDLNALLASLKSKGAARGTAARLKRPSTLALSLAATIGAARISAAAKELDAEDYDVLANLEVVDDLAAFDVSCLPGEKYGAGEEHEHDEAALQFHARHGSHPHYLSDPFASRLESPYARHHQDHDDHDARVHATHAGRRDSHDGAARHSASANHQSHGAHEGRDARPGGRHEHQGATEHRDHVDHHQTFAHAFHEAAHDAHAAHGETRAGQHGHADHHGGGHARHAASDAPGESEQETMQDHRDDHEQVSEGLDVTAPAHEHEHGREEAPDALPDHRHHHDATLAAMEPPPAEDLSAMTAPLI